MRSGYSRWLKFGSCLAAVAALAVLLISGKGRSSDGPADAVSPNGVHFDPGRIITLQIGALEFRVQNKYLVFPWPEGFDPTAQRGQLERLEAATGYRPSPNMEQDLALKFDLPDLAPGTLQQNRRVIAIVKYLALAPVDLSSTAQIANYHDRGSDAVAAPTLDTHSYKAFWLKSNSYMREIILKQNMNMGHVNDEVRFASKNGFAPKIVRCMWPDAPDGKLVDCDASTAFLRNLLPAGSDTHPTYVLQLTVAPAQIDRIGEIMEAVSSKIRPWITIMPVLGFPREQVVGH